TAASEGTGLGSTFTVRLPAGIPDRDLDDTIVSLPRVAEPRRDRGLRLLLVEDHADTAEAMADLLRALGHEVTVARSLAEARPAAQGRELALDLMVSDLGLPDGSGLDLMSELAEHGLRGIALSGYGMDEDIQRSRDAGFAVHLTKPVTLQALQEAILQAIGR
ncbi:MAG TPA: response regulator, partial [Thermoanaerobaculia bacterium]|nr:response regulator [Thermoanaerobaculia bacterium]